MMTTIVNVAGGVSARSFRSVKVYERLRVKYSLAIVSRVVRNI